MRQLVQEDPGWREIFLRRLPGNAFGRWDYVTNFWRGAPASGVINSFPKLSVVRGAIALRRRDNSAGLRRGLRPLVIMELWLLFDHTSMIINIGARH